MTLILKIQNSINLVELHWKLIYLFEERESASFFDQPNFMARVL